MYFCANCNIHACDRMQLEASPKACPSLCEDMSDIKKAYCNEQNYAFNRESTFVSMHLDGKKPRVYEIVEFAKRCGFKKIGLAFCASLAYEARIAQKIWTYHGLAVESVICKVGGISRELFDIYETDNAMCNPIGQAKLLNKAGTELNVLLGLCVGHDSLFIQYSNAPVTVLADKDRVLAHNPLGAIYQADGYYKDVLFPPLKKDV